MTNPLFIKNHHDASDFKEWLHSRSASTGTSQTVNAATLLRGSASAALDAQWRQLVRDGSVICRSDAVSDGPSDGASTPRPQSPCCMQALCREYRRFLSLSRRPSRIMLSDEVYGNTNRICISKWLVSLVCGP